MRATLFIAVAGAAGAVAREGMVTLEKVEVIAYRSSKKDA